MAPAIRVENLGKRYIVDHEQRRRRGYRTLRETLVDLAALPLRRLKGEGSATHEDFWALKDVNFVVQPGEVVGIIGRNGAGKSTLLKILSQITKPTKGRVELNGRVGSLLEVGTGFHPELTGRENIYLNGSILGMTKREIDRKFDEIVDFAEIEQFLDTPVKRFSSGMYVRLAFAVAAYLEPEILIVDEVLAVGDAGFRTKCIEKMGALTQTETTILIVSHDIATLRALCGQAVLLESGEIRAIGSPAEVIAKYSSLGASAGALFHVVTPDLHWHGIANRPHLEHLTSASDVTLILDMETGPRQLDDVTIDTAIMNSRGEWVIHTKSVMLHPPFSLPAATRCNVRLSFPTPQLAPGDYTLMVYVAQGSDEILWAEQIPAFTVTSKCHFGRSSLFPRIKAAIAPVYSLEVCPRGSAL